MDSIDMSLDSDTGGVSADPVPRNYQLEALEKAIKQNTVVFLETGSGKTLIAIMLLRSYAYAIRKPSPFIAIFLVPTVVLVNQQGDVVKRHSDLKVGKYWGDMGIDYWGAATWEQQVKEYEVLVMTPAILLSALRHGFLKLDIIKVLIFDECHNARGKHPYACIMKEFYHLYLESGYSNLPRIFGMTASPIKAKGSSSPSVCWQQIHELENLMNSKVYTCVNESVIAEHVPFSTPKLKLYVHIDVPSDLHQHVASQLGMLKGKYENTVQKSSFSKSIAESTRKRLDKVYSTLLFCVNELGIWLAVKAAECFSRVKTDVLSWERLDGRGEAIVKNFSSEASSILSECMPSSNVPLKGFYFNLLVAFNCLFLNLLVPFALNTGPEWCIGCDTDADINAGYLTSKVICLYDSLLEYRDQKELRCIIFVERVITAIVLQALLNELLLKRCGWRAAYMAGNNSSLKSQSRNEQHHVVDDFRKGTLHIIVATSILEEGLDVKSCNLVIRYDPSATVCSFIQSRGRARMQSSDFLIMVKSGDTSTLNRICNYVCCGTMMREESLIHALVPCTPLNCEMDEEHYYKVQSTGACVNLASSIQLLHFYCSRLPCDGYFKSYPRYVIDKQSETCTLHLPRSCPLKSSSVEGDSKDLKQLASLKACEQLHKIGELTDNLVPNVVAEEKEAGELRSYEAKDDEQMRFVPPELVGIGGNISEAEYFCYLIELLPEFDYDIQPHDIILAVKTRLECDEETLKFDVDVDKGRLVVQMRFVGSIILESKEVFLCQQFQVAVLRLLLDRNLKKLCEALDSLHQNKESVFFDYLLLPVTGTQQHRSINWEYIKSVQLHHEEISNQHLDSCVAKGLGHFVNTINGLVCRCILETCLVCTPHNGFLYCITGTLDNLNGNSMLELRTGGSISYTSYFRKKHGINLRFVGESLLHGRRIFTVQNYVHRSKSQKSKEASKHSVELPPELCSVIMAPVSAASLYSFSHAPLIMHRIESFLIAANLKRFHVDQYTKNAVIPTLKVLEAITTKKCLEKFHLESLETLGDSFLKYAISQQLFKTLRIHHEGLLSIKREKIISNASLCKLGCDQKISGFIRNEPFDPKLWIIPGDSSGSCKLEKEMLSAKRMVYVQQKRSMKNKRVADAVEALIGAFLSTGGETAALLFMKWLGIEVDFSYVPYSMPLQVSPEKLVNVHHLEALLNYKFRDASLLVEALTHGSYMLPEIPRCYQRLEFLGDAVLDYLITTHLYFKHPALSPGLLTDLRSASVNNDCYSQSAIKAGLHKHILHASHELHRHIANAVHEVEQSSLVSTFGWDSETMFPKVLGDVIESLAGAILVDSEYNKEILFQSIKPLLEPMITPEMLKTHPVRELDELCNKERYAMKKPVPVRYENGNALVTVEVEANGITHDVSASASDKKTAKRLACKEMLKLLKEWNGNSS
ncbi:OLC1v1025698C1 [Oldenlandia corymbosa var. corymbosa]|nr:OLC1v1025698C1 [Oldenlandia corymbosa var. corymbosa]